MTPGMLDWRRGWGPGGLGIEGLSRPEFISQAQEVNRAGRERRGRLQAGHFGAVSQLPLRDPLAPPPLNLRDIESTIISGFKSSTIPALAEYPELKLGEIVSSYRTPIGQAIQQRTRSLFGLPGKLTAEEFRSVFGAPTPSRTVSRVSPTSPFTLSAEDLRLPARSPGRFASGAEALTQEAMLVQSMEAPITDLASWAKSGPGTPRPPQATTPEDVDLLGMAAQVFEKAPGTISDAISNVVAGIRSAQAAGGLFGSQAAAGAEASAEVGMYAQAQAALMPLFLQRRLTNVVAPGASGVLSAISQQAAESRRTWMRRMPGAERRG